MYSTKKPAQAVWIILHSSIEWYIYFIDLHRTGLVHNTFNSSTILLRLHVLRRWSTASSGREDGVRSATAAGDRNCGWVWNPGTRYAV